MHIKIGDTLPEATLFTMTDSSICKLTSTEIFKDKRVVLFALPGAFTPTCSAAHLPGYVLKADEILARGVDNIVCLSVNDPYVMSAWGEQQNVEDQILMLADGNLDFTRSIGLEIDRSDSGMGYRSQRYSMLVNNRQVEKLYLEKPGAFEVSDAQTMLDSL